MLKEGALTEKGFKEVVLTGVDISAYGEDLPGTPTLGQLVRRLLAQVPELSRLRISSIDAVALTDLSVNGNDFTGTVSAQIYKLSSLGTFLDCYTR